MDWDLVAWLGFVAFVALILAADAGMVPTISDQVCEYESPDGLEERGIDPDTPIQSTGRDCRIAENICYDQEGCTVEYLNSTHQTLIEFDYADPVLDDLGLGFQNKTASEQ